MRISVIIPTYNGAHKVTNVLKYLEQQSRLPDETIVVIDGSTDNTEEVLRTSDIKLPGFKIIAQKNGGRGQVRNRGANEATGDLLLFLDDDMRPLKDCVAIHEQHHLQFPDSILTGGLKEEATEESSEMLKFKSYLSDVWNQPLMQYKKKAMPQETAFLTAANCSVSKAVWMKLGGLDERLNDAEDYDFSMRAARSGVPMYFNMDAFAWHDDKITCASYIRRLRQYAKAQSNLQSIKPELYSDNHKYAVVLPTGLKAFIFKSFCHKFWIDSVDKGLWKFLPQFIRYRLYDWIITANGSFYTNKVQL